MTAVVVIAKECRPGFAKTRLHPPLSLAHAAEVAQVCLDETMRRAETLPASRRVLYFDGSTTAAEGWEYLPQCGGTLDERLAYLCEEISEPFVVLGMDTPQFDPDTLRPLFPGWPDDCDAAIGLATDGGYWFIGMREPHGELIRGVRMSRSDTGAAQIRRLQENKLRVRHFEQLRDLDSYSDLCEIAGEVPVLQRFVSAETSRAVALSLELSG